MFRNLLDSFSLRGRHVPGLLEARLCVQVLEHRIVPVAGRTLLWTGPGNGTTSTGMNWALPNGTLTNPQEFDILTFANGKVVGTAPNQQTGANTTPGHLNFTFTLGGLSLSRTTTHRRSPSRGRQRSWATSNSTPGRSAPSTGRIWT